MMTRWTKWRIAGESLALMALLYLYLHPEPVYHGYTLNEWFEASQVWENDDGVVKVFRENSERSVPFLIGKLREKEPAWHAQYVQRYPALPAGLRNYLPAPEEYKSPGNLAAEFLGQVGKPAQAVLPELLLVFKQQGQQLKTGVPAPWNPPVSTLLLGSNVVGAAAAAVAAQNRLNTFQFIKHIMTAINKIGVEDPQYFAEMLSLAQWQEPAASNGLFGINFEDEFFRHSVEAMQHTNNRAALRMAYPILKMNLSNTNGNARHLAMIGMAELTAEFPEATQLLMDGIARCAPLTNRTRFALRLGSPSRLVSTLLGQQLSRASYLSDKLRTEAIIPALIAALKSPEPVVRDNAALLLVEFRYDSVPGLKGALLDENPEVRGGAQKALNRILWGK